jgi:co-chaperonin GroES (HSP10)
MQQVHLGNAIKNDMWITEDEIPDPSPLPELPGYHILVRPISVKGVTKGGIVLPDSTKDDMAYLTTVGKVLSIGELAYQDEGKFPNGQWCRGGDFVCYAKHAGQKLFYKSVRLLLLFDDQVICRVEHPKDLDPTFNLTSGSA